MYSPWPLSWRSGSTSGAEGLFAPGGWRRRLGALDGHAPRPSRVGVALAVVGWCCWYRAFLCLDGVRVPSIFTATGRRSAAATSSCLTATGGYENYSNDQALLWQARRDAFQLDRLSGRVAGPDHRPLTGAAYGCPDHC